MWLHWKQSVSQGWNCTQSLEVQSVLTSFGKKYVCRFWRRMLGWSVSQWGIGCTSPPNLGLHEWLIKCLLWNTFQDIQFKPSRFAQAGRQDVIRNGAIATRVNVGLLAKGIGWSWWRKCCHHFDGKRHPDMTDPPPHPSPSRKRS